MILEKKILFKFKLPEFFNRDTFAVGIHFDKSLIWHFLSGFVFSLIFGIGFSIGWNIATEVDQGRHYDQNEGNFFDLFDFLAGIIGVWVWLLI